VIPKISHGTRMRGLGDYLFGPGHANEHTDPRLVAASAGLSADGWPRYREPHQFRMLIDDLDAPYRLFPRFPGARPAEHDEAYVWHCSISLPADERPLSDAEWAKIAHAVIDAMDFSGRSGKAPTRWMAVHHGRSAAGNDHIHLAVCLVREDGTRASTWMERRKLSRVCARLEREYGLTVITSREGAGMPGITQAEAEQAQRHGREPQRLALARAVRGCAVASRTEAEFVARMRHTGLQVWPRYSRDGRAVVGYSVADTTHPEPVRYGGGSLARDLTLPRLRRHWHGNQMPGASREAMAAWAASSPSSTPTSTRAAAPITAVPSATTHGPAPAHLAMTVPSYEPEMWDQAARIVGEVRQHLASVPASDTARWAGAAREASGVLAALAQRAEGQRPGPLAYASDLLARSAQTRFGEPHALRAGRVKDLRGVAMVAATAATGQRAAAGQWALLRQLTGLMHAVHNAHLARGEARSAQLLAEAARGRLATVYAPAQAAGTATSPAPSRPPLPHPPRRDGPTR
jgi:hypothetical protein